MSRVQFRDALADVSRGKRKIPQSNFLTEGDLAVVDQGKSLIAGYTNELDAAVNTDGPLIVFGDHTRTFKYVDFPFAMGADGVKVLKVREGFHPKFIYHFLASREIPSAGYSRHFKFLKEIEVPKPAMSEQRRIAAILDHADAIRTKRRQVRAHLDDLTRAVFTKESGDSKSAEGRTVPLAELASVVTKGTTPTSVGLHFANTGVPFLRAQNLQRGTVAFDSGDLHIDESSHQYLSRSQIQPQDLLISIAGTIGRVAIVPEDAPTMNCNQAVAIVRLHDRSLAPWVRSWLQSEDARRQINASAVTATISNLSLSQIRRLQVPEVSDDVARSFGTLDGAVGHRVKTVERAAAADDRLFASLQSRAFRGEL